MKKLIIIFLLLSSIISAQSDESKEVTFKVVTHGLAEKDEVYITGNVFDNWETEGARLNRTSDSTYEKTFKFEVDTELIFKFTRGSWETEGLDSNGVEFHNFSYVVKNDTALVYKIPFWRDRYKGIAFISKTRLENKNGNIELLENWKYHPGDDSSWASPKYNDSDWIEVDPRLQPVTLDSINWNGQGWFRLNLKVDSSLWNEPLALHIFQTGASEIYLNGKLLYEYGKVDSSSEKEKLFSEFNPRVIKFAEKENQLIAVRYSNFSWNDFSDYGVRTGFYPLLGDLNQFISMRIENVREYSVYQMVFTTLSLALAIIHLLLFAFYPKSRSNLFYSISMFGFALLVYSSFQYQFLNDPKMIFFLNKVNAVGVTIAAVFGLLTAYQSVYNRIPRHSYFFTIVGFIFILVFIFFAIDFAWLDYIYYGFLILLSLEIFRVIIVSFRFEKKTWGWITGAGFLIAMLSIFYQILIITGRVDPIGGVYLVYVYGLLILAISVSINLSREIAKTNRDLEKQLVEVKRLSKKTIEQERRAKEEEISRRLLEADNARKTKELEEARRLQISMLPQNIPSHPKFEIAVKMRAATEVGGDYYDFNISKENHLTVAIGDATGHGMRAGTMVATVKGLFQSYNENSGILTFLEKCNNTIKSMNLGNLYMAMQIAKFEDKKLIVSSAGMPSVLIYRAKSKRVDTITVKGMPLGGFNDFPYQTEEVLIEDGDKILFMSDGFPELFNEKSEMIGYEEVCGIFLKTADKSPDEIIKYFFDYAKNWMNGNQQNDDMTFVVVERKSN